MKKSKKSSSPIKFITDCIITFFAIVISSAIPFLLLWMVILAIFPSTYKVVEIPLCGQEAYLSIEIENVLVKEVDENMDYTGYEKWDQETNIYCVGDGNKREVSTQGWLYLTAFSSILLPLVLLIGMVLNVSLGFIKKMIFKKN